MTTQEFEVILSELGSSKESVLSKLRQEGIKSRLISFNSCPVALFLLKKGVSLDCPAMLSIGYRELAAVLDKKISQKDAIQKIKRDVRQYAKRQLTWFRHDKRVKWIPSV